MTPPESQPLFPMIPHFRGKEPGLTLMGRSLASLSLLLLSTLGAQAALYNLTKSAGNPLGTTDFATTVPTGTLTIPNSTYLTSSGVVDGAAINGGIFQAGTAGSGSGTFRSLYKMAKASAGEVSDGYNRDSTNAGEFETSVIGQLAPLLVQQLVDSGGYYRFSLDLNESGGLPGILISLDELQLYVGGTADPSPLPQTVATLGSLGTKIWDLQDVQADGKRNQLLMYGSGSGVSELNFYVPTSLFAGFGGTQNVYLYSMIGDLEVTGANITGGPPYTKFTGLGQDAGFSEWATLETTFTPPLTAVPELSSSLPLLCLLIVGLVSWRSRPCRLLPG